MSPTELAGEAGQGSASGAAAVPVEVVGSEEVLCADELTYVVKRKSSDIFVEFRQGSSAAPQAGAGGDLSQCMGCWYGCEEDGEEGTSGEALAAPAPGRMEVASSAVDAPSAPSQEEVLAQPEDGPRPFADPAWNVIRLASWAWAGCDLDEEAAAEGTVAAVADADQEPVAPAKEEVKEAAEAAGSAASAAAPAPPLADSRAAAGPNGGAEEEDPCAEGCVWYLGGGSLEDVAGNAEQRRLGASGSIPSSLAEPGQELVHISSSKVEWRIWAITAKMKQYSKGTRIFSPEFDTFNISNLGLVFYPNGNSNAKQGFCSLGLKAPHGTHLRYKLYIGGTERFTDLRHNITESWGFVDMCKVEDEFQQEEDLLRLGVEIIDDIDAHETLKTTVSPNKVEWVVGNMQNKLRHYRKDIALYSDEFSVGGVDKLRLKFYPSGKKEADLGWCSLYLEAPKGSELRCRLSVGKKSMSFDRLEKFGEDSIWGFLTLCKLHDELEQDTEVVRVSLEVLETKRLDGRLSEAEDAYLKTLAAERRTYLLGELDRIEKLRNSGDGSIPSRFRILQLEIPDNAKSVALSKLDAMHSDVLSGESSKLKKWIDGLLSIPFGTIRRPLCTIDEGRVKVQEYLEKARLSLNEAVYGHDEPKNKIVQLLCQWIANPTSMSLVLGIQGPPGNGKTTLARKGIAEALQRPFVQISLGGATDASVLEGHSYTYVGSTWGRIAGLIMEAQCMNPVIFFDELDKVSDTPRGEEITGVLTHLTDHSQNRTFTDRYFEGIPLDLSRALFIFSFNDESKINHVLKDRLTVINTEGFDQTAKLKISQEYLLPELLDNVGLRKGDVDIGRDELNYLCQRCGVSTEEGGVRGIKQALESVILRLNELRMTQDLDLEEKADVGAETKGNDTLQKADGEAPADGEKKADGEQKVTMDGSAAAAAAPAAGVGEQKADGDGKAVAVPAAEAAVEGECKADSGEKEQRRAEASARRESADTEPAAARSKRKLRVTLPVKLTKELIEQLVTQVKAKENCGSRMMYI
mmetsp:Transcript_118418/g.264730  ORF Transcript_118418/g.264730 Transcript_118418/m.264730 type:complete len:1030 (-) Transcript_118418:556-3645(-)